MALCQKFGRLLIGVEARFFARTDVTNFSTSLDQSPAPAPIHPRLPPGYKAPNAYSLFVKDQMMGKSGGVHFKILSTNWKSLSEDEKQNYSERAKKIGDELRDNFEKLTDDQKKDLWDKHAERQKFYAETNRPKRPVSSYLLFMKERFEKQAEPIKTSDERKKAFAEAGQQWQQMTDAEKQPYVDQVQANYATYRMEMAEWRQNHTDEIKAWKKANKPKARAAPKEAEGSVEKEEWSNDDDDEEAIQREKRQKTVQEERGKKPKKTEEEPEAESYVENAAPKMTET